jgi:NADPH:quinone reductase
MILPQFTICADNVGGYISDAVYDHTNKFARVAVCGSISMYNSVDTPTGPYMFHKLIYKSVTVAGFVVSDFAKEWMPSMIKMAGWIGAGKLKFTETILDGFDKVPEAFIGLFEGKNIGKMQIKVHE